MFFLNYRIPNFDKSKELVINLVLYYPYFPLISWDIALNQFYVPVLIEANLSSGMLDFPQRTMDQFLVMIQKRFLNKKT